MKSNKMYFGILTILFNSLLIYGAEREIDCNYIIVYPDSFLTQANEMADYRSDAGFDVCTVSWDSIFANNTYDTPDSSLKNYLQIVWDSSSVPLEYIVLLGDWDIITPHARFFSSDSSYLFDDNWYAVLDTSLLYSERPSVGIGRIPVEDVLQLEHYLDRLYLYENGLQILPWQQRVIGISGQTYPEELQCHFDNLLLDYNEVFINQNLEYEFLSNCNESNYSTENENIRNKLIEGNVFTLYNGRSNNYQWDIDTLLNFETVRDLNYWEYSPIMITATVNQFARRDSLSSIAKELFIKDIHGPVAIYSSSWILSVSQNNLFFNLLLEDLLSSDKPTIGESLLYYKNSNIVSPGLMRFVQIFGDPAIIPQMIRSESDIREPLQFEMSINNENIFVSIFPDQDWNYVKLPLSNYSHVFSDSLENLTINQINLFPDGVFQDVISGNILIDDLSIGDSIIFSFDDIENWNVSNGINNLTIMQSNDTPAGSGNSLIIEFGNSNNDSPRSSVYSTFDDSSEIGEEDTISFWIKQGESFVGIDDIVETLPKKYKLYPAYPNPFNPTTTIRFSVEMLHATSLQIFDITGRLVETLLDESLTPGDHEVTWNAGNLPSGVYFVRLQSGEYVESQKVILLK